MALFNSFEVVSAANTVLQYLLFLMLAYVPMLSLEKRSLRVMVCCIINRDLMVSKNVFMMMMVLYLGRRGYRSITLEQRSCMCLSEIGGSWSGSFTYEIYHRWTLACFHTTNPFLICVQPDITFTTISN